MEQKFRTPELLTMKLDQYGADTDAGLIRCGGNADLYLRIVESIATKNNFLADLRLALEDGNTEDAFRNGENLCNFLFTLKLTPFYTSVKKLLSQLQPYKEARDGVRIPIPAEAYAQALQEAEHEKERLCSVFRKYEAKEEKIGTDAGESAEFEKLYQKYLRYEKLASEAAKNYERKPDAANLWHYNDYLTKKKNAGEALMRFYETEDIDKESVT